MVNLDGKPLFKPRHTNTVGYELTPEELELYNAVTRYVRSRRKQAKEKRNRNVELTLMDATPPCQQHLRDHAHAP